MNRRLAAEPSLGTTSCPEMGRAEGAEGEDAAGLTVQRQTQPSRRHGWHCPVGVRRAPGPHLPLKTAWSPRGLRMSCPLQVARPSSMS